MTLKTRRLLFYSSLLFFLIAAALVIFYAMGFRIDFENKLIQETGGIYVKSNPVDVEIRLDGEQIKNEAGILDTGTLIDDLRPGEYQLVINLADYSEWKKNIDVKHSAVSIFDSVVLVAQNREKIRDEVDGFYFANDLFVTESSGAIEFDGESITGNEIAHFTENGIVITKDSDTGDYYLSNIFDLNPSVNLTAMFNSLKEAQLALQGAVSIVKIQPYPYDDRRFVVLTERAIYTLDTEGLLVSQIDSSASDFIVSQNEVYWINDAGMFAYNLLLDTKTVVYDGETGNILQWNADSSAKKITILENNGELLSIDNKEATTTTMSTDATYFDASPGGRFLVFVESTGLTSVYDFEWEEGDRGKQEISLVTLDTPVKKVIWYIGNTHLFIKTSDNILRFVEIDSFLPTNEVSISEDVGDFAYDSDGESLYYANDSGLWRLEF
ncbi:MAG: hypothetical protein A3C03_02505 [Candidatus Colwellbacteria bacterium RIFCSPHIGHO2_02_FULL_45_17]|nr:MAG: hypothetical protein A3C03_02505 [Candidatus Colwellbacteria bacterium RIFCSPHIGHO2_02_FULL_45_17]